MAEEIDSSKQMYEDILLTIDDALTSEIGEEREFNDQTNMKLDEVSTMLKEALGLPEDYTL